MVASSERNARWARVLVESLARLGLRDAVIAPGSRSTPLTLALAEIEAVEAVPVLDERSAAFFALGIAKRSHRPVAVVCSSGTAAANFLPAIVEAHESRTPLLVLTADRPPELRDCNAGQTIDQVKLYGSYPNWQAELALPSLEPAMLAYLRQTAATFWERAGMPAPGPVHLNVPFRDPLVPTDRTDASRFVAILAADGFFANLGAVPSSWQLDASADAVVADLLDCERGIIICGPARPADPGAYACAIGVIAERLGWPVLADGLSPVRNVASCNPQLVAGYAAILRNERLASALAPEHVLRFGELPTSKELRTWLERAGPRAIVADPVVRNVDPLHLRTRALRIDPGALAERIPARPVRDSAYRTAWLDAETRVRRAIDREMTACARLFEPKVAWLIARSVPAQTPVFISNSMPVRDVESFWLPSNARTIPYANRGANGIDGIVSTALGVAHRGAPSVLLIGDLAFLHDQTGLLIAPSLAGHLTIVVVDNNGGGIFQNLPIAELDPPFERFFATPQAVDLGLLCRAHGVAHRQIGSWTELEIELRTLPAHGVRVLVVPTDRRADAIERRALWARLAVEAGA